MKTHKLTILLSLLALPSVAWAVRGGPPSDHTPFFAFIALLVVFGIVEFFKANRDIGAVLGGMAIMLLISMIASIIGAKIDLYEHDMILIVGLLIFLAWLFYPLIRAKLRRKSGA